MKRNCTRIIVLLYCALINSLLPDPPSAGGLACKTMYTCRWLDNQSHPETQSMQVQPAPLTQVQPEGNKIMTYTHMVKWFFKGIIIYSHITWLNFHHLLEVIYIAIAIYARITKSTLWLLTPTSILDADTLAIVGLWQATRGLLLWTTGLLFFSWPPIYTTCLSIVTIHLVTSPYSVCWACS